LRGFCNGKATEVGIRGSDLSCDELGGRQEAISLDDEDRRQFLKTRRKGDPLKMELAAEIRKQTSMTMAWIAKELNAGAPNSIWNAMRRWRSGV